ncbi:MAG TPA: hypothetical protein VF885_10520 [Arthrobacter sp.]
MLISEIEPPLSPLVIHGILAVFLGSSAIISGSLILWSEAHSRATRLRLLGLIATGALLFSGGMAGWNIGGDQLRAEADARFESLLAERFAATGETAYRDVKSSLTTGDVTIVMTSGGQDITVTVKRASGVLRFFSSRGTEYLPVPKP